MKKKTKHIDIWEILDYKEEDYREMIIDAGFDPDKEYEKLGRSIAKLEFRKEVEKKREVLYSFKGWMADKIKIGEENLTKTKELQLAFNKLNMNSKIEQDEILKDLELAKYFKEFWQERKKD